MRRNGAAQSDCDRDLYGLVILFEEGVFALSIPCQDVCLKSACQGFRSQRTILVLAGPEAASAASAASATTRQSLHRLGELDVGRLLRRKWRKLCAAKKSECPHSLLNRSLARSTSRFPWCVAFRIGIELSGSRRAGCRFSPPRLATTA
jgi:hypothetical protein